MDSYLQKLENDYYRGRSRWLRHQPFQLTQRHIVECATRKLQNIATTSFTIRIPVDTGTVPIIRDEAEAFPPNSAFPKSIYIVTFERKLDAWKLIKVE